MPAPQGDRRLIDTDWPCWRRLPAADGLVALLPDHRAPTAWADVVLAHDANGFVVWAATGTNTAPSLALLNARAGVQAAALAPAGDDPRDVHAALRLACRLAIEPIKHRSSLREPDQPVRVPVTSAGMPDTNGELMRVAHLVTLRTVSGVATDTAMWELLTADTVASGPGVPRSALDLIEAHLPALLALRTATRSGRLPAGLPPQLAALLNGLTEPLSTEVVWRHLDPLVDHLTERPASL